MIAPGRSPGHAHWARWVPQLHQQGIHQLRVAWADLHGGFRSKTLVCGAAADDKASAALQTSLIDALNGGIGMVSTLLLKDSADRSAMPVFGPHALLADGMAPEWRSASNMQLMPDPQSFLHLPWAPGTGWLRADPVWADGRPVEADPRRVLQRAVAELRAAGFELHCGLEVEFHVYRIVDERAAAEDSAWPAAAPRVGLLHPGYQLLSEACSDATDAVLQIVRSTALGLGLPLRSLEIEFGPSQFEAVFAPTDALAAADHLLLFRNGVRQALRRAGYHASFACRPPFPNAVASGWHVHQSLVDAEGRNGFARGSAEAGSRTGGANDARHVLSDVGAHWLAGLLAHADGMAALCVPTIPGYQRLRGSVMAPCAPVWGFDNRGAMLRVLGSCGSAATRIENRLPEPMANPYLALAAQIAAGLDGLQRRLDPGAEVADPYAPVAMPTRSGEGTAAAARLPASLGDAVTALAADTVLQRMLGPSMSVVYDAVRRQELARHAAAPDAAEWEAREYFGRF